jgi:hypothetical protein
MTEGVKDDVAESINDAGERHKNALAFFVVSYLVFAAFSVYLIFAGLGSFAEGRTEPILSSGELAFISFFMFSSFLTAVTSQIWFLLIKPRRERSQEEGQSSSLLYLEMSGLALIVVLAVVDYLVRVGSYFAGSSAWETYPPDTIIYMLNSTFREVNAEVGMFMFIGGPVYMLLLFFEFRGAKKDGGSAK